MENRTNIAVLGAGGWGTALAALLGTKGYRVRLWARRPECVEEIRRLGENREYLPGVGLPETVEPTSDLGQALVGARMIVLSPPSQAMRSLCSQAAPHISDEPVIVSTSKGIDPETLQRMSEVIAEELPAHASRVAVLSGPNFAAEVARGKPTVTVVASANLQQAEVAQELFSTPSFRVYTNPDIVGVELGGALKNIYAIATGVVDGLELGDNARAGLITRALAELARLGIALGAEPLTFAGLAGMGDLVLTCTGDLSRNRRCGLQLGEGQSLEEILSATNMVVEGVGTTKAARSLARKARVELPVADQLYQVLFEGLAPAVAVNNLMTRGSKGELEEVVRGDAFLKPLEQ